MGASLSNLTESTGDGGPGLGDIPEGCVARVFIHLTPPEICNLARLNRAFRGAASADPVWEAKLPSNYRHLLALALPQHPRPLSTSESDDGGVDEEASVFCDRTAGRWQHRLERQRQQHQPCSDHPSLLRKKDIFALLSRPIPLDQGTKEVWLNRVTGGVCMSISAKAMAITGIDDRRYWTWIPTEESRFHMVAYLQQMWWFEVRGMIKFPFPVGVYILSYRLHLGRFSKRLGRRSCNYEHTHGWDIKPVKFELSTSDGQQISYEVCLDDPAKNDSSGNSRCGKWIEYQVGEFVVSSSDTDMECQVTYKETGNAIRMIH
uniref:F-box protein PP2-A15 n=1 Tax=Anthurium amnicola TaxID=1678845 RepID=A0A1D1ZCI8_9ARAE